MSELSQFFLDKALKDFGEDETKRKICLDRFREWIVQHPFLTFHDLDETCLLMFLRGRKYQMDKVCQSIEQMSIFLKNHPQWNKITENEMPMFLNNCKSGMCLSKFRDSDGRRIITLRVKQLEDLDLSQDEYLKTLQIFLNASLYEQETQIAGIIFIFDLRGITFNLIKKYSIFSLLDFFSQLKYCPIRIKQINLIGMPTFAVFIFKFVKKLLSSKLQKRINLIKDLSDLNEIMDTTELLKDDKSDFNEENVMIIDDYIKKASKMYDSFEVDFNKLKSCKSLKLENID
ncbi:hypothetical protein PVAND_004659 [Polypedilum vanderplanki]|uniref:CRAL-TRIO domain-containing protein n=1 Tax=Polypedilum vanderplanki TaxID=319348 RepID=A0A9J6BYS7_POLVA|nr:hypothetical protein PVAND_004659 [Polypedilum vanderplanki]